MDPQILQLILRLLQEDPAEAARLAAASGQAPPQQGGASDDQIGGLLTPSSAIGAITRPEGPNQQLLGGASPPRPTSQLSQGDLFGLLQGRMPARDPRQTLGGLL